MCTVVSALAIDRSHYWVATLRLKALRKAALRIYEVLPGLRRATTTRTTRTTGATGTTTRTTTGPTTKHTRPTTSERASWLAQNTSNLDTIGCAARCLATCGRRCLSDSWRQETPELRGIEPGHWKGENALASKFSIRNKF